jgi:hypothetical protein
MLDAMIFRTRAGSKFQSLHHIGDIRTILSLLRANLEILLRRIPLLITSPILLHSLLRSTLILLKVLHLLRIHMLHHSIRLPLFETETHSLMTIVLIIRLILVVLHLNEVRIHGVRVETERDQGVDGGCLGDDFESPGLFVFELYDVFIVADDFVALVFGVFEELGEGEPLAGWEGC